MIVAYLGNFEPKYSTENIVARALERNGHRVVRLQEGTVRAAEVAQRAYAQGADFLLWTQTYGLAVSGGTVEERHGMLASLRECGIPSVGYHLDKWWGLSREDQLRSGEPFFAVDRLVTADGGPHDWDSLGIEHRWMPPAVDEDECRPGDFRPELAAGVCFVGGWLRYGHPESTHRFELIAHLRRRWGRHLRLVPRKGAPRVNGQALRDVYASAKVVVGDSCLVPNAPRYWSDRVPETLGRGGFLLHPKVEGLAEQHPPSGLVTWEAGNWDQLDALISHYIGEEGERRAIAEEGRRHVLAHHTYTVRMRQLVDLLREEGLVPYMRRAAEARGGRP